MATVARLRTARRQARGWLLIPVLAVIVCAAPGAMGQQSKSAAGPSLSAEDAALILDALAAREASPASGADGSGAPDVRAAATDATNAARTMLYDIRRGRWSPDILALFDIPAALLPEVRDCAADFGTTTLFGGSIPILGVADHQPAKFAGMECVQQTSTDVTEYIFGRCTSSGVKGGIGIPGFDSFLVGWSTSTPGLWASATFAVSGASSVVSPFWPKPSVPLTPRNVVIFAIASRTCSPFAASRKGNSRNCARTSLSARQSAKRPSQSRMRVV